MSVKTRWQWQWRFDDFSPAGEHAVSYDIWGEILRDKSGPCLIDRKPAIVVQVQQTLQLHSRGTRSSGLNDPGTWITPDNVTTVRKGLQGHEGHAVVPCGPPENRGVLVEPRHVRRPFVQLHVVRYAQFLTGEKPDEIEPHARQGAGHFQHLIDPVQFQSICVRRVAKDREFPRERAELRNWLHPRDRHVFAFKSHRANFFSQPGGARPMDFFSDPRLDALSLRELVLSKQDVATAPKQDNFLLAQKAAHGEELAHRDAARPRKGQVTTLKIVGHAHEVRQTAQVVAANVPTVSLQHCRESLRKMVEPMDKNSSGPALWNKAHFFSSYFNSCSGRMNGRQPEQLIGSSRCC